jgi:hypothetical protein
MMVIEHVADHPKITVRFLNPAMIEIRQEANTIHVNHKAALVLADFIRDYSGS